MKLEDLSALQDAIDADLELSQYDLVKETARTPKLYTKYLRIYLEEKIKLRTLQKKYYILYKERREYYLGKAPDEVYKEEPQDQLVLRQDVEIWLNADKKLQTLKDYMILQEEIINILEKTLKEIERRTFHIKNIQEQLRFEMGG